MAQKIDVASGDPYRDPNGHFGESPAQKLEAALAAVRDKKFVAHDGNKKKIDSLSGDAKAKLATLRAGGDPNALTVDSVQGFDVTDLSENQSRMILRKNEKLNDSQTYGEYYAKEKNKAADIYMLTPSEYKGALIDSGQYDSISNVNKRTDPAKVDKYAKAMEAGDKFPPLAILYDQDGTTDQEGLHRADAATKAGIARVPVAITYSADNKPKYLDQFQDRILDITGLNKSKIDDGGANNIGNLSSATLDTTLYHGTSKENADSIVDGGFNPTKPGMSNEANKDFAYFVDTQKAAKFYSESNTRIKTGAVVQTKVSGNVLVIKKPMQDFEAFGQVHEQLGIPYKKDDKSKSLIDFDAIKNELSKRGFVGIQFKDSVNNNQKSYAISTNYKFGTVSLAKDKSSNSLVVNAFTEDQQRQVDLATEQFKQSVTRVDNQILAQYIAAVQAGDYAQAQAILKKAKKSQQTTNLTFALLTISAILLPLYAKQRINSLLSQFGLHTVFAQTKSGQAAIQEQAKKGAESHVNTIAKDLLGQLDAAIEDQITTADVKAAMVAKYPKLKDSTNYFADVKNNKAMYKFAQDLILNGSSRDEIIKALQANFPELSKKRATVIAGNESNRVFTLSQFEADEQFLAQNKLTDKAYKRLVSNTGHPCPICNSIIIATHAHPIPFKNDFAKFGEQIVVKYEEGGKQKTAKFTPNYEHLRSGHIHVNCHCRYELLIKRPDGTWINSNTGKVENDVDFEPELHPRDKKGKFAKKGTTIGKSILDVAHLNSRDSFNNFVDNSDMEYTKQQQFVASKYQSHWGYTINDALRVGDKTIKMNDEKLSTEKFASTFDSTFNMTIPDESTLFRGVGDSPKDFIVGKNYQDKGYMSTTTVEQTARKKFKGPGGAVMHLTVPAGQKVAVPDIISGRTNLDEQEALLPRGSSYSVYKVDGDIVYAVIV